MSEKFDIYAEITDRMIQQMEQGIIPWQRPWTGVIDGAVKHRSGQPYSLLNQMLLGEPGEYMSFLECKAAGGSVRKGAKSRMVVFYKPMGFIRKDEDGNYITDDQGNLLYKVVPLLRYSKVFHIRDCEGIAPKWDKDKPHEIASDETADAVLADYCQRSGVRLVNRKQNRAYYSPMDDSITLPLRTQFTETAEYYSTAFHEATHSTGHASRLARFHADSVSFGDEAYSKEELVAEIGAAAICHSLGLESSSSFTNSTAYVQAWMKALKNDKRLIVSASAQADKAARMILNITEPTTNLNDEEAA